MRSLILRKIALGILPIAILFAVYLLLRGHNEPGGGFIAGLVTAAAVVLQGLAFGVDWTRRHLMPVIRPAFAVGIVLAVASGVVAWVFGDGFLTHYHVHVPVGAEEYVHLSTTLIFDIGVYLVVVGTVAMLTGLFAGEIAGAEADA